MIFVFSLLYFAFVLQGFRACGRDKGAMETDEVCGRPLDPFGAHTHVSDFVSLLWENRRYTN
jgi:hypothetical protein